MLGHIRFLEAGIADLDTQIDRLITPFEPMLELVMTIPGVDRVVGICLIAEIGVDMTIFPTAEHLASWAGICPGNHASGGRRRSGTPKAIGATRHDILIAYWHILAVGTPYQDLGPDWNRTPKALDAQARRLISQLEALGKKVTIDDAA
jgi:hypothetical protein